MKRAQGVRLPPDSVQRNHELATEPFTQRVRGDKYLELENPLVVAPEGNLQVDALLDGREPELVQARDRRLGKLLVREIDEGVAAPQRVRLDEDLDGPRRLTPGGPARPSPASRTGGCRPRPAAARVRSRLRA